MGLSGYCLQSWRDVFGELSVGLRRLGVTGALRRTKLAFPATKIYCKLSPNSSIGLLV